MPDSTAVALRLHAAAYFGVLGQGQTYRNALYVLLAPAPGLLYFVLVAPGLAVGVGTATFIGLPLLVLLSNVWWRLASFERRMVRSWLGVEITPPERPQARLLSAAMGKLIAYLLLKLPLGGLAALVALTLLGFPLALMLGAVVPAVRLLLGVVDGRMWDGGTARALTSLATLGTAVLGVALAPLALRILNVVASAWGRFARFMLGVDPVAQQLAAAVAVAARAEAEAARAEQGRRTLIVNVSHELRTPIASIRGHVESLLMALEDGTGTADTAAGPGDRQEYLRIVYRETERLSALVDDLLALARAEAGELRLALGPVAAAEVIAEVYASMAPLAKRERRVTVVCDVTPNLPPVWADRQRLGQVLLNLVRNAIMYTPAGGIVSVALQEAGPGRLALIVADTGIGIPPDELEHIFERFYRADASRARATGGFGLGLAIVRELVTAMGGSIGVESTVEQGSSFRLLLPLAAATPADGDRACQRQVATPADGDREHEGREDRQGQREGR